MCYSTNSAPYVCNQKTACANAYGFFIQSPRKSMVTEFGLFCEREHVVLYGKAVFLLCGSVGSITLLVLANFVGRLPVMYICCMCMAVGATMSYFAGSAALMFAGLSFCSVAMTALIAMMNIYMNEVIGEISRVDPTQRSVWHNVSVLRAWCDFLHCHQYMGGRVPRPVPL